MGRSATLLVVDAGGRPLGSLGPFEVAVPWWNDAEAVVAAAREATGVEVTVLRLLDADVDGDPPAGGAVSYLVEAIADDVRPRLAPWPAATRLVGDPHRASWAEPGGPSRDLAWADAALARAGMPRTGPARQVRSWNLSSLWRLPTGSGAAWLKVVPPFFAHEGDVLQALAGGPVPRLIAHEGPRSLLVEVPGIDGYEVPVAIRTRMIEVLVALQHRWAGRAAELLALGMPDWRPAAFVPAARRLVRGPAAAALDAADRRGLEGLVAGLPTRFEQLERCGLPDGLVHGDFHGGNVRIDGDRLVVLDWGDSGIGHPLLDLPAFLEPVAEAARPALRRTWSEAWRAARPGSDPDTAAELIAPVAALRQALLYDRFLRSIEASERRYHVADVPLWLRRAAALAPPPPSTR